MKIPRKVLVDCITAEIANSLFGYSINSEYEYEELKRKLDKAIFAGFEKAENWTLMYGPVLAYIFGEIDYEIP